MCAYVYTSMRLRMCMCACVHVMKRAHVDSCCRTAGCGSMWIVHVTTCSVEAYTGLVSNSAPTWSSRCCFTACDFQFGKKECNSIRIEPN